MILVTTAAASALLSGLLLDAGLGEPKRWHPLAGFGRLATAVEKATRRGGADDAPPWTLRLRGAAAWLALVGGLTGLLWTIKPHDGAAGWLGDVLLLYLAVGGKSLAQHGEAVRTALAGGDLEEARRRVGWIVSRDTAALDPQGVAGATVESVLENGCDAVFGAIFWFLLLGGAGAAGYRLANTLDAMWGYKTPRYRHFGWAAARADDLLNYLPARLTALTYALLGRTAVAWRCWRRQAPTWKSPNAGPVMAAGAGALGVRLGGAAVYHGVGVERPPLGEGRPPEAGDISAALALVRRGVWLWAGATALLWGMGHA
ncbi:MAG: cobalamin biosynthesis protein [Magnetococcales bacterium]|nr:cobalamin biosynthesis protein [Magnetococcales bacterium]